MRRIVGVIAASAAIASGVVIFWRRNPRVGSGFMNAVVNPRLLSRGMAGGRASEIGTLEHVGRTSGVLRLTPVHPEPTRDGFRIVVPLGPNSHWARNVLAAGHCRLQLHETVYDLDEPAMIPASEADGLPAVVRAAMAGLGFQYLTLHTFSARPGSLEPVGAGAPGDPDPGAAPAADFLGDMVSSAR